MVLNPSSVVIIYDNGSSDFSLSVCAILKTKCWSRLDLGKWEREKYEKLLDLACEIAIMDNPTEHGVRQKVNSYEPLRARQ